MKPTKNQFKKTTQTQITRKKERASYDMALFKSIIDESMVGHLSFSHKGQIHGIPLLFWCYNEYLYFHCSIGSRIAKLPHSNQELCVSFSIIDGLVLAKSAMHHSVNYRSAMVYGKCQLVEDFEEKERAFECLINLNVKNRWDSVRPPTLNEWKAVKLLKIPMENCVVKQRKGPPNDKAKDRNLSVWSGSVSIKRMYGYLKADEFSKGLIFLPKLSCCYKAIVRRGSHYYRRVTVYTITGFLIISLALNIFLYCLP